MSRDDVSGSWSARYAVGLSAPLAIPAIAGQNAISLKLLSGGTLEIGGATTTNQTWGSLYPIAAGEIINIDMSGTFYLWASGATCVAAILRGRTSGTEDKPV